MELPAVPRNWMVALPPGIWVALPPLLFFQLDRVSHDEPLPPVQSEAGMPDPLSGLMVRIMKPCASLLTSKVRRLLPMRSPKGVP